VKKKEYVSSQLKGTKQTTGEGAIRVSKSPGNEKRTRTIKERKRGLERLQGILSRSDGGGLWRKNS